MEAVRVLASRVLDERKWKAPQLLSALNEPDEVLSLSGLYRVIKDGADSLVIAERLARLVGEPVDVALGLTDRSGITWLQRLQEIEARVLQLEARPTVALVQQPVADSVAVPRQRIESRMKETMKSAEGKPAQPKVTGIEEEGKSRKGGSR